MDKKDIKAYLKEFEGATGLKAIDENDYVLSSSFGDIKVTFDLKDNVVFTKLLNPKEEFRDFGFNPYSGKRNYIGNVYDFLYVDIVTADIKKSETAITAKVRMSIFDKMGENKMYDISIFKGDEIIESVTCISYTECMQTGINFNATMLNDGLA